jgi:hypothetical protein
LAYDNPRFTPTKVHNMSWLTSNLAARAQGLKPLRPMNAGQALTVEKIRASMLATLADGGSAGDRPYRLKSRIQHAPDAQGLWALRGELMAVLASVQGEARAVGKLLQLTSLFREVLPQGLASNLSHPGQMERHAGNDASMKFRQQR